MARASVSYVCQQCGAAFPKWAGKCDDCGTWNTLVEERKDAPAGPGRRAMGRQIELEPLQSAQANAPLPRMQSDISEFDRVAGGGLVPGSATLIGGDPGIGKSTLLLQLTCNLSKRGFHTAYISGEESPSQIKLRGERIGKAVSELYLLSETKTEAIFNHLNKFYTNLPSWE